MLNRVNRMIIHGPSLSRHPTPFQVKKPSAQRHRTPTKMPSERVIHTCLVSQRTNFKNNHSFVLAFSSDSILLKKLMEINMVKS